MHSKASIFNLALGALLLQYRVTNPDTDKSANAAVLNTNWDVAFWSTLEDMDLDSTATQAVLELVEEDPTDLWAYAYKYPSNCAFFRRIQSSMTMDNITTHIPKRIAIHEDQKVIFTNQVDAIGEYISTGLPIASLSATAGLAIALRLAVLASPLIVGKGASGLRKEIEARYILIKAEAQEQDRRENFNFTDPEVESEFVNERLS